MSAAACPGIWPSCDAVIHGAPNCTKPPKTHQFQHFHAPSMTPPPHTVIHGAPNCTKPPKTHQFQHFHAPSMTPPPHTVIHGAPNCTKPPNTHRFLHFHAPSMTPPPNLNTTNTAASNSELSKNTIAKQANKDLLPPRVSYIFTTSTPTSHPLSLLLEFLLLPQ
ncbi:hypothetical protein CEPID_03760 [Corynebacterium epidermidicanis]|uniref:Uncharacterized protein n=1 Tax=Corynebacterium epidermidicanis TaxID=1050174 RepID=A0A0G3GN72_9CORY|nr:hypothetical protein CEPID_03760 [Corynebacterium epidermidicanis]